MSKKNLNTEKCAQALTDPNDYFGENYMNNLSKSLFTCFVCSLEFSKHCKSCLFCEKNFYFCNSCYKSDADIIIGLGRCIYCHRKLNKLLADHLKIEQKGIYGDELTRPFINLKNNDNENPKN